jgi:hypothetical protein
VDFVPSIEQYLKALVTSVTYNREASPTSTLAWPARPLLSYSTLSTHAPAPYPVRNSPLLEKLERLWLSEMALQMERADSGPAIDDGHKSQPELAY